MLARMGVPGLALWLLTLVSWSAMLLVNMARARRFGDNAWADLFVLILCYELAFIIDSTFNVVGRGTTRRHLVLEPVRRRHWCDDDLPRILAGH